MAGQDFIPDVHPLAFRVSNAFKVLAGQGLAVEVGHEDGIDPELGAHPPRRRVPAFPQRRLVGDEDRVEAERGIHQRERFRTG